MSSTPQASGEAKVNPCEYDRDEPCLTCGIYRGDHELGFALHDYEPVRQYICAACSPDTVWDSDNIDGHPGYDHDFDPIEYPPRTPHNGGKT